MDPGPAKEEKIDLHNNSVGASIGQNAKSFSDVENECKVAVTGGRLQTSP